MSYVFVRVSHHNRTCLRVEFIIEIIGSPLKEGKVRLEDDKELFRAPSFQLKRLIEKEATQLRHIKFLFRSEKG